ncbi:MAG: hypothetical protein NVSMB29_12090 [Candidatus Dormibacteria bacterium]
MTARDFSFQPTRIPGQPNGKVTVTFVNNGSATHSFTVDATGQEVIASPGGTQTLTVKLPSSGSLTYRCKFHPTMTGTFAVGSGAPAPSSAGPSEDGGGGGY